MSDFAIHPYEGAGGIRLGMTPEQVRDLLKSEFTTFFKSPTSEMPTDAFRTLGLHVCYKKPGVCNAIEFHPKSNPLLHGRKLMGEPASKAIAVIGEFDLSPKIEYSGLTSDVLGINLYIPDLDESSEAPVKAVLIFEKGYYGGKKK